MLSFSNISFTICKISIGPTGTVPWSFVLLTLFWLTDARWKSIQIKEMGWAYNFFPHHESSPPTSPPGLRPQAWPLQSSIPLRYLRGGAHRPMPSNRALVEPTRYNERPSIELKISSSGVKITNAVVVDLVSQPLYSISSRLEEHKTALAQGQYHGCHHRLGTPESMHGFPWEKAQVPQVAAVCWT
jgi:hypothetical protein